jgi:energy-coupling factor transporter transmembrane protein EcfT
LDSRNFRPNNTYTMEAWLKPFSTRPYFRIAVIFVYFVLLWVGLFAQNESEKSDWSKF